MWKKGLKVRKKTFMAKLIVTSNNVCYRVYYNHYNSKKNETNPGEWPWVVAIFMKEINQTTGKPIFVASGTLVAKDLVATVAHKMTDYAGMIMTHNQSN